MLPAKCEKLMLKEKILAAINSAVTHLDNSVQALAENNDEKAAANSLWLASSETEYALFLFSLIRPEKLEDPPWKRSSQPKQTIELNPALAQAQSLLQQAKSNMEQAGATEKAYEEVWTARNLMLKAQELFERKRKASAAQSTR